MLAILLVPAASASAITRTQGTTKALRALGSGAAGEPLVVFALRRPLRAGTRVTQARTKRLVAKAGRGGAFFVYEDRAPSRPYPHPGRVALVSVRTGKVTISRTIRWAPLVDGRLPAFLRSRSAYRSPLYRVYEGSPKKQAPGSDPVAPSPAFSADPFVPTALESSGSKPKAYGQHLTVKQDSPKRVVLTATDDDGDLLTYHVTRGPSRGTLSGQPPDLTYTPNPGYVGPDSFAFKARDDDKDSNTASVQLRVVAPGAPPVVTTSAGCTSYAEQGLPVVVDGQLGVSDPDDTQLDHATVRIVAGFQPGDDLVFADQNGITSSYDETAGVLTLVGTATVAQYQAALSAVRYRNDANGNPTATKDVEFVVNDAGSDSPPATKQICVTGGAGGGNDPPVGEPGEGGLAFVENDGPVATDGGFVVGDADSTHLSGATIKFIPFVEQPVDELGEPVGPPIVTDTFAPAEDELAFADQNGISGAYDAATGVMTLTGAATLADYETAMRSVTYENTSEDPSDATRRLRFQLTDSGGANSIARTRDVFVTPVNDAPEVEASAGSTDYTGAATAIDPALEAIDVDDDDLEGARVAVTEGLATGDQLLFADQSGITGAYDAESGVLTLGGTASVADYEAALRSVELVAGGDPSGSRTVTFATNDGELDSGGSTKHLEINDPPSLDAGADALAYTEGDGPVAVDPGLTATDPESTELAGATVSITAGFDEDEDELAFADQNGITGAYDDATGVLTLSGGAPIADYEAALRSVTYENASDAPTPTRTIAFSVDDGRTYNNVSNTATRDVAVTPVDDAPQGTASDEAAAYTEGDPPAVVDDGFTVADVDDADLEGARVAIASGHQDGDALAFDDTASITGVYDPESGVLTLTGTASVADYEAALRTVGFRHTGDDPAPAKTVEFTVNDGELDSTASSRELAVTGVNDKPVLDASDDALAYGTGAGAVAVDPGLTATDPDSAQLAGATVAISAGFVEAEDGLAFADQNGITGAYDDASGTLTLTGTAPVADYEAALRSVTYANDAAAPSGATRTVTFRIDDGGTVDNLSDAVSRDVEITVADAPVVTTTTGTTSYTIGDPPAAIDAGLTVTDVDDTSLEGARVRVASGLEAGDELLFSDQSGITGAYVAETGLLTLTGTATLAAYEAALRSVQYRYTGENPSGSRTISFRANDGASDSAPALKALDVLPLGEG